MLRADRDRYIEEHLPRVRALARAIGRRLPWHVDRAELISAGYLALTRVAERFDPSRGLKFWTFAYRNVRGAMMDYIEYGVTRTMESLEEAHEPGVDELPARLDAYELEARRAWLQVHARTLTPRQREVIAFTLAGWQIKRIAARMRISETGVLNIKARAIKTLRHAAPGRIIERDDVHSRGVGTGGRGR